MGRTDGMYFSQDRMTVVDGRMANPDRVDGAVITANPAQQGRIGVLSAARTG